MSLARRALVAAAVAASARAGLTTDWPTTEPSFPHYPGRKVTALTGTWAFGRAPDRTDPLTVPYSAIVAGSTGTASVPSCVDIAPMGVLPKRGQFFFRASHACTPGSVSVVFFEAVNFFARVLFDGAEGGTHSGPYTPFSLVTPACSAAGTREVAVVVDNTVNSTLSPTFTGGDFFAYGGIVRPVIVTELAPFPPPAPPAGSAFAIDRVEVSTRSLTGGAGAGTVDVRVWLLGDTSALSGVPLSLAFNGAALPPATSVPWAAGCNRSCVLVTSVPLPAGTLPWALGAGNLFTLDAGLGAPLPPDVVRVRSGARVIGVDAATGRLTLNGNVVSLHGFNRHTMWPDTGLAVTPAQEAVDVQTLNALNANYIRGAHYPQSQSFVDLLDENGIALWEETLGPGVSVKNLNDPNFMAVQIACVHAMARRSFNHPAVILHGFFNEGPSDNKEACAGYAASAAAVRDVVGTYAPAAVPPATRLVTWANNHGSGDVCIQHEDVIAFNSYPGCVCERRRRVAGTAPRAAARGAGAWGRGSAGVSPSPAQAQTPASAATGTLLAARARRPARPGRRPRPPRPRPPSRPPPRSFSPTHARSAVPRARSQLVQ